MMRCPRMKILSRCILEGLDREEEQLSEAGFWKIGKNGVQFISRNNAKVGVRDGVEWGKPKAPTAPHRPLPLRCHKYCTLS